MATLRGEGCAVDIHEDGSLSYLEASTSTANSTEELGVKKMRMMSIEEVFKDVVKEREEAEKISWGVSANEIFKTIGLSFKNSKSLESKAWADLSEHTNEDEAEMYETRKTVLQDTATQCL